jgi:hypothetical protein
MDALTGSGRVDTADPAMGLTPHERLDPKDESVVIGGRLYSLADYSTSLGRPLFLVIHYRVHLAAFRGTMRWERTRGGQYRNLGDGFGSRDDAFLAIVRHAHLDANPRSRVQPTIHQMLNRMHAGHATMLRMAADEAVGRKVSAQAISTGTYLGLLHSRTTLLRWGCVDSTGITSRGQALLTAWDASGKR